MRFFHLSDLHIGLKLFNRDLIADQNHILRQILDYVRDQKPDALLIAGDIYDKAVPSAEAVSCFDAFLSNLTQLAPSMEIMMISGNHDSAPRLNLFRSILKRRRIHMIGMPPARPDERMEKITLEDAYGPIHFYLLPFIRPSMVKEITGCDEKGAALTYEEALRRMIQRETIDASHRNVFVSHQFYLPAGKEASEVERMDSEMVTVGHIDAVPASLLSPFDYAALGHIHKPMKVGGEPYRYCGTPLPYSVSEAAQDKGILLVEMREKGFLSVEALPLLPLRPLRRLKGPADALLRQGTTDYVSLCLTDPPGGEADFDLWDRLRFAFPNLLEIQREAVFSPDYRAARAVQEKTPDTYSLCLSFLGEVDEEKKRILRDILTSIGEGESL